MVAARSHPIRSGRVGMLRSLSCVDLVRVGSGFARVSRWPFDAFAEVARQQSLTTATSSTTTSPHFGATTPVEDITAIDVDAFKDELLKRVSHRTAQKALVILHGVVARSERKGGIKANLCKEAESHCEPF